LYDERQLFTENPIDRYAIGDRNALKYNSDGSLDLYIQRESPGADKESNWLPTPKSGSFTIKPAPLLAEAGSSGRLLDAAAREARRLSRYAAGDAGQ
jgi:hypothetical protein